MTEELKKGGGIKAGYIIPDITPKDEAKRQEYVSGVSSFYETIGRDLFEDCRRDAMDLLRIPGNTHEEDIFLKANLSAFDTIEEFCKTLSKEHETNAINRQGGN